MDEAEKAKLRALGEDIARLRGEAGLSQEALAKLAKSSQQVVSRIENADYDKRGPNRTTIEALRKVLTLRASTHSKKVLQDSQSNPASGRKEVDRTTPADEGQEMLMGVNERIERLQRMLGEKDELIDQLQNRVDELERTLPLRPTGTSAAQTFPLTNGNGKDARK